MKALLQNLKRTQGWNKVAKQRVQSDNYLETILTDSGRAYHHDEFARVAINYHGGWMFDHKGSTRMGPKFDFSKLLTDGNKYLIFAVLCRRRSSISGQIAAHAVCWDGRSTYRWDHGSLSLCLECLQIGHACSSGQSITVLSCQEKILNMGVLIMMTLIWSRWIERARSIKFINLKLNIRSHIDRVCFLSSYKTSS